jgi:hypothetical protein
MNTVMNLVEKDSSDYTLAKTTLEDLEKNKTTSAKNAESLTAPEKQTTIVEPPIDLPQEATPPASN